jgi:superfamily II DNA/RNA helicase
MTEAIESSTPTPPSSLGTGRRFRDFQLAPDVLDALSKMGIETPTPIQDACIPSILEGRDVIGKAETGTGKTIGFGAPLVGRIDTQRVAVQALILTPTRELAQQVAGVIELLGAGRGLGVVLVVGGVHASEQVLKLRSGSQVVVGTPGRVLDFLRDRTLSLVWCETIVLDEADRMLDMGFIDDVSAIIEKVPEERQTLLFSATIPPAIKTLLNRYMKNPAMFSTSQGLSTVSEIKQVYVEAEFKDKFRALEKVLDAHADGTVIIFCNTRRQAIDLDRMLWGHGYSGGALHGDQEQDVRFKILEAFRGGEIKILVATDVASRGLDIEDVACVVNYEIPDEAESYVHRIGRTGRAQKRGEAISIVSGKEWGYWQRIMRDTGFAVERVGPERVRKSGGAERGRGRYGEDRDEGRGGDRGRRRGGRGGRGGAEPARGGSRSPSRSNGRGQEDSGTISNSNTIESGERCVDQEQEGPSTGPIGGHPQGPVGGHPPRTEGGEAQRSGTVGEGHGGERSDGGGQRSRRRRRRGRGGQGGGGPGGAGPVGGGERRDLQRE